MTRKASRALQMVPALPPLTEREAPPAGLSWGAFEWQGEVRLAADRASGLSAPRWQQHVRTGLLERALALGSDHCEGPHRARPEAGRRLLAHIDALAEAGLSPAELASFAEEAELDQPGALWVLTILFGCVGGGDADEAFDAWVASLDPALFLDYRGIKEIARALTVQPDARIGDRARRWPAGSSEVLAAIALETMTLDRLSDDALLRLTRAESPLVRVALERLFARSPEREARAAPTRGSWMDLPVPALAHEMARARVLEGDREPLLRLRQGDTRAIGALGSHAIDVIALAGAGSDQALARDLSLALPTTAGLVDAIGLAGLPALFPRLLDALEGDDFDEEAHGALATALGSRVTRPSRQAWEQVIAGLPKGSESTRIRGGEPHGLGAVLEEMKRPELSAEHVRARADEVIVITGKPAPSIVWDAFGVTLEGTISEVARAAR
jgi:hypothetical protein